MDRKVIVLLFILCSLFSCETTDPYQGHYIDLSFEEKLTVGQPDSLSEATLTFSRDVRVGPEGKIFAADAGVSKVKVYSQTGEFINSFGQRGRGPGEFTDIKGFAVTDSTVLIWDQNLQRINVFGLDGEFQTVYKIKGVASPMHIYPLQNSYLALHIDNNYGSNVRETQVANIYSDNFSKINAKFLKLKEVDEKLEEIPDILRSWYGYVLIRNNQEFLFIPFLNNGNIYEYQKSPKGWANSNVYKGLNQQNPYTFIDADSKRKPDGSISSIRSSKRKQLLIHNFSRGLLEYKDYIFHFTFSDIQSCRVFGVEVYDEDLNPLGYSPIKSLPITNKKGNLLNWFVEDVDKKGNFYLIQRNDEGTTVRVLQVSSEDLKKLS